MGNITRDDGIDLEDVARCLKKEFGDDLENLQIFLWEKRCISEKTSSELTHIETIAKCPVLMANFMVELTDQYYPTK